jgi:hypothetical protein
MLLVLSVVTYPTSAVTGQSGVKAGDTADYKVVGSPALPYNRTHIAVLWTKGYYVALTSANYRPNGTLYSVEARNWSIDWYGTGSWNIAVFEWVVGSNFTNGAEILSAFPGVVVQNNLTMTVLGVSRFVLHANGSSVVVSWFDMYFDRLTGLVTKGNYFTPVGWINVTLISTTAFSPAPAESPFSTISIIAIAGVGIVALVAGFLLGGHGKRKK